MEPPNGPSCGPALEEDPCGARGLTGVNAVPPLGPLAWWQPAAETSASAKKDVVGRAGRDAVGQDRRIVFNRSGVGKQASCRSFNKS